MLAGSVTELLREDEPLPDFAGGYEQWKEANGGIWTVPIAEIIDALATAINQ